MIIIFKKEVLFITKEFINIEMFILKLSYVEAF